MPVTAPAGTKILRGCRGEAVGRTPLFSRTILTVCCQLDHRGLSKRWQALSQPVSYANSHWRWRRKGGVDCSESDEGAE